MKLGALTEELLGPGSMRRGAGDLGLAFFLRSSSMVGGMDLLDLELPSFALGDLFTLLRELEDLLFLAMLRTWKWEVVTFFNTLSLALSDARRILPWPHDSIHQPNGTDARKGQCHHISGSPIQY